MRYSVHVISRTLRSLAIAVPLSLAVAVPAAHAGSSYSPAVNAITISGCAWDKVAMSVTGAVPGSSVSGSVVFTFKTGDPQTVNFGPELTTAGTGELNSNYWSKDITILEGATAWTATVNATLVNNSGGGQKIVSKDRVADCGLPETGSNAAPIGQIALGVTLGGGLLAAVAIRRRPRKSNAAA